MQEELVKMVPMVVATLVADRYEMMDNGNGWMWFWGGLMLLLTVLVVGAVVWAVARTAPRTAPRPHDRAHAILAERFARGEITSEEYRERAQHLG
jgi:putative membrane protein